MKQEIDAVEVLETLLELYKKYGPKEGGQRDAKLISTFYFLILHHIRENNPAAENEFYDITDPLFGIGGEVRGRDETGWLC